MSRRAMMVAPVAGGGGSNGFKRSLTLDHTQVGSSDSSDWPLAFAGTFTYLATVANGGKTDNVNSVRFYSDSGLTTLLKFERVANSATGAVEYWVKIPTLSHTSDTVIYMKYGAGADTSDVSDPTNAWDTNFQLVQHYGTPSSLSLNDSTSHGNNGSANGSPAAGTGLLGGGIVTSTSNDAQTAFTNVGDPDSTISFWMNASSNASQVGIWSWASVQQDSNPGFLIQNNAGTLQYYVKGAYRETSQTITTGTWYYITITFTGNATYRFYRNASLLSSYNDTAQGGLSGNWFTGTGYNGQFAGTIDEMRYATTARSADWLTAEYNNQKPSSTFITIGSEVPL